MPVTVPIFCSVNFVVVGLLITNKLFQLPCQLKNFVGRNANPCGVKPTQYQIEPKPQGALVGVPSQVRQENASGPCGKEKWGLFLPCIMPIPTVTALPDIIFGLFVTS